MNQNAARFAEIYESLASTSAEHRKVLDAFWFLLTSRHWVLPFMSEDEWTETINSVISSTGADVDFVSTVLGNLVGTCVAQVALIPAGQRVLGTYVHQVKSQNFLFKNFDSLFETMAGVLSWGEYNGACSMKTYHPVLVQYLLRWMNLNVDEILSLERSQVSWNSAGTELYITGIAGENLSLKSVRAVDVMRYSLAAPPISAAQVDGTPIGENKVVRISYDLLRSRSSIFTKELEKWTGNKLSLNLVQRCGCYQRGVDNLSRKALVEVPRSQKELFALWGYRGKPMHHTTFQEWRDLFIRWLTLFYHIQ